MYGKREKSSCTVQPRTVRSSACVFRVVWWSISDGNLTLDINGVSEVPEILEVLYEIDEEIGDDDVDSPASVTDATDSVGRVYFGSDLLFGMPVAAAVIASVVLLVCCFCCLRCAIGYDGLKRQPFYGTKRRGGVKSTQRY
ncbi:uncharacterized protein LOC105687717 isoform X1 [Athalia rosae]|uniref:uncharacterized protein LOC105687717 isoform X1 n=1 Tax=Athalia rosae TaxID=37344 RepID=UPI0020338FA1|nr:uncharacterized protein LOC105687717 isoform X1 [Athalia rosae]